MSEAVTNAVVHAYRDDTPGPVRLDLTQQPTGAFDVVVADRGIGMAPRVDSPGIGMGLPLITHLADKVGLERPDEGGTEVVMCFGPGGPAK